VQILELEFLLDIGLEAAAPEPGIERVASGASRQRAMERSGLGCLSAFAPTVPLPPTDRFPTLTAPGGVYTNPARKPSCWMPTNR
jgi:hypothetical protein